MVKEEELIKAVKANNFEKVERLYVRSSGSFIKRKEKNVPSSLELAQTSRKVKVTHINVNCHEEETGYTPFIIAVLNGFREIALSLIYHSADVNEVDNKGNTALHMAVFCGMSDMIDLIINCGATINQANTDGNTPLHVAVQNCATGKLFLIFKLLQFGANLYAKNKTGHTPLDQAAVFGKQEAASALIDHDNKLRQNTLAIVEASVRGHAVMVQVLLDNGVEPNRLDPQLGTGPLHEAIRYERTDVASILLSYGADPYLSNAKGETASRLASACTPQKSIIFTSMIKECANKPKHKPRFSTQPLDEITAEVSLKRYPPLKNSIKWTKDTSDMCSSCTASNPNYNILDGNPKSFWVIPATSHSWCIFDMGSEHTLTGIVIIGWDSPQMVKKFEIQRATSKEGPWSSVASFTCQRLGTSDPHEPGTPQDFHGFCVTSQYWRLMIVGNHGGQCICFQGVQFYGVDTRVPRFFTNAGFEHLSDAFVMRGYNTYSELLNIQPSEIENIVTEESDKEKLELALKDLKLRSFPFTMLNWLRPPATFTKERDVLPQISVQADPEVCEELELTVHPCQPNSDTGACVVKGDCRTYLRPNGPREASVATFHNIQLCTVGHFIIEVRSIRFPGKLTRAADPINVVAAAKDNQEVSAAFDEISDMLADMSSSLDL